MKKKKKNKSQLMGGFTPSPSFKKSISLPFSFFQKQNHLKTKNLMGGFTLIELMVSISIFMSIMLMAMGAVFVSLNAIKKVRAQQTAMDNVSFAMESMARSIRLGTKYYCGSGVHINDLLLTKDCTTETVIAFLPQDHSGSRVVYRWQGRDNETNTNTIKRCEDNMGNCFEIISPNVNIEKLSFRVKGSSPLLDKTQPSVFIIIKGTVTIKGEPTSFAIQTMASQRNLE